MSEETQLKSSRTGSILDLEEQKEKSKRKKNA